MKRTWPGWLAAVILMAGCGSDAPPEAPPRASDTTPDGPPYVMVADVQQLMNTVLDPAAEVYWDAVGTIIDADGVHDFAPETPEEWEAVRNAAYVLAESGNLLMMEGRAVDREGWSSWSTAMIDVSRRAIEAAEARDEAAVFDAGAEVYLVCAGCHATYALETVRPSDLAADSAGADAPDAASGDDPGG